MVISRPIHLARINACARLSSIKLRVICLAKHFFVSYKFGYEAGELSSQNNTRGAM